jgi:hypothetical protein
MNRVTTNQFGAGEDASRWARANRLASDRVCGRGVKVIGKCRKNELVTG